MSVPSRLFARAFAGLLLFAVFDALGQTTADIGVSIGTFPANYTPGATVSNAYQFTVTNNDASETVNDVGVSMSFTAATVSSANWTCSPMARCDENSGTLADLSTTVDLAATEAVTFTFTSIIFHPDANASPLAFTASFTGAPMNTDGTPGNDTQTAMASRAASADLSISVDDSSLSYTPGSGATYNIVVSNAGPSDAVDVTVEDIFTAEFASASWTCSATGAGSCANAASAGAGVDSINDEMIYVAAGGSATFVATVTYASNAVTDPLVNTASLTIVDSETTDPDGPMDS